MPNNWSKQEVRHSWAKITVFGLESEELSIIVTEKSKNWSPAVEVGLRTRETEG